MPVRQSQRSRCPCQEFELCSDPGYTAPSGPSDPTAYNTTSITTTPPAIANNVQPAPAPQYTDPFNDPTCPKNRVG